MTKTFAQDPRPERIRVIGTLPRRNDRSPAVLVRFDPKPKVSEGGLHLPLSQQVEPDRATVVSATKDSPLKAGMRVVVKCHMNGDVLEGTDCHWLAEDDVLGVDE